MKVIDGGFGKKKREAKTAAEVFELLAEKSEGYDEIETIVVTLQPGHGVMLHGNVGYDAAAMLLITAQLALATEFIAFTDSYDVDWDGGDDEPTKH